MPFYEYKCASCAKVFTLLQKRDAKRSGYDCPDCGSQETERILSTFASAVAGSKSDGCPLPAAARSHCCGAGCGCGH